MEAGIFWDGDVFWYHNEQSSSTGQISPQLLAQQLVMEWNSISYLKATFCTVPSSFCTCFVHRAWPQYFHTAPRSVLLGVNIESSPCILISKNVDLVVGRGTIEEQIPYMPCSCLMC